MDKVGFTLLSRRLLSLKGFEKMQKFKNPIFLPLHFNLINVSPKCFPLQLELNFLLKENRTIYIMLCFVSKYGLSEFDIMDIKYPTDKNNSDKDFIGV